MTTTIELPEGFVTTEIIETFTGMIQRRGPDGNYTAEYGTITTNYGFQHTYDDGELRITVTPGDRETYTGPGWYVSIESMLGKPGRQLPDEASALAHAANEVAAMTGSPEART